MLDIDGPIADPGMLLLEALETHAQASLEASATNARYAQQVAERAQAVADMIDSGEGEVERVVMAWYEDMRAVTSGLFVADFEYDDRTKLPVEIDVYLPTLVHGIWGRVGHHSSDEIMGPLLTLDLRADPSVTY